jgi:hypothetical protein
MGPEARDLFVQLSHYLTNDLIVDVAYDRHTQGYGSETVTNIYEAGVRYFTSQDWQITGGYRFEQRSDRGRGDNHIVEVGLIGRF